MIKKIWQDLSLRQYLSVDHDVEDSEEKERDHPVHQAVQDDQVHLVHL